MGEWQVRCRPCYASFKKKEESALQRTLNEKDAEISSLKLRIECLEWELNDTERRLRDLQYEFRQRCININIPPEQWRRLMQLSHPDKHGGSATATEVTRWLLENRP